MAGIRVHALAKKMGLSSKELMEKLESLDVKVKGHMSALEPDVAALVESKISGLSEKKEQKAKAPASKTPPVQDSSVKKACDLKKGTPAAKKHDGPSEEPKTAPSVSRKTVTLRPPLVVRSLAEALDIKVNDLIRELMKMKIFAAINQTLSPDVATAVMEKFHCELIVDEPVKHEEQVLFDDDDTDDPGQRVTRSPIVTMMGHVDHGKTTLLDKIRKANVVDQEHGGITQHIGAYEVFLDKGRVVFLDTPGHKAFTAMRARGANATDVVVLVVAADDGIMPQTKEVIDHARSADVTIVVAITKIDKPGVNVDHVKQQLTQYELTPEDWGGKTTCVPVSGITGEGVDDLLELLLLESELLELKANPEKNPRGVVIEAHLSKGRGPVATVLVQDGTLRAGDIVVCGCCYGKARALINDRGKRVSSAGPATPIEIAGLSGVPLAGDKMTVVKSERVAREFCQKRIQKLQEEDRLRNFQEITLENLHAHIAKGTMKELHFIVKADVQGSLGVLRESILELENDEVKVRILHDGIGGINESDVMLAKASKAIILGFHVRPAADADQLAQKEGVQIRCYSVIYELINEIKKAIEGMLDPEYKEVILGRTVIKQIFRVPKVGTVAGCYVQQGKMVRKCKVRVIRDGIEVYTGVLSSLKRFKDDVREVQQNYECGLSVENYNDLHEGDVIEAFTIETIKKTTTDKQRTTNV